ncbi:MAG: tRNA (adenosine(37)-N6)-threonylcarbamoyltransferase complex dimerization subunit type 1 TsaB [Clostridia bacterium]|nr:tRNA (adenosine(37)-N6)-threonylcarbamoyltransferase complex dimerization subunit type 1 TsaB [Clostridia bacterium]
MLILALDTSGRTASCALLRDGTLLDTVAQDSMMDHSRLLLPLCEQLLKKHGLTFGDVDVYAAVAGPGSFTGVRIGTAAVKGFAWAQDKPCAGVSSLLTMACDSGTDGVLCCSLKARPGESFYALFRKEGDTLTRLTEDAVGKDEEMEAAASSHGATVFLRDCQRASGAAKAAWMQAQSGTLQNCHEILPAYLRLSQAERLRKERLEQ